MSNFGKGITVTSGFDLGAKAPLDSRLIAETLDELQEHIDNNRAYEGMMVYVKETQLTYQYLGERWMVFTSGGGGSGQGTSIIINDLNSFLINASLSANQGRVLREMIETVQSNFYTKEEIDQLHEILNNKDLQFEEKFNNISNYLPRTLSSFINDMNFVTEENFEEILSGIEIPIKTSQLENDAGYITEENLAENVINKIPITTSQLVNDSNYVTEENLYTILENMNFDGITGDGFVHIGNDLPPDKQYLWIDISKPTEKITSKYIEMLHETKNKLNSLSSKMTFIEENIGKITSSENQDKIKTFRSTLSMTKNEINVLFLQIENLKNQPLTTLKSEAKRTRKTVKKLIYSLIDFDDEVMRVLDSELIFDYSGEGGGGNNGDDNDDVVVNNASILTEDGVALLTEDGLLILADGIEEVIIPNNAITDESGKLLLTESGLMLLADEIEKSEIFADAILTELGYALMTENGKQILKG